MNRIMHIAQTKGNIVVPSGFQIPMLPNSLEAWTKKTQMCTTETHQPKHEPGQVENLKIQVKNLIFHICK